jgi:peroxiredoxin
MVKRIAIASLAFLALTALTLHAAPPVGSTAPAFTLQDQNGKSVSLADYAGKVVVLEWFNEGCPFVQAHYQSGDISATATKYAPKGVVWLAINSTGGSSDASNKAADGAWHMDRPILNDSAGAVGHAYGATNTPEIFVIGTDGKIAYEGAFDNDPRGEKTGDKVNYAAKALDEVLAGKPVSEPQTVPYGCHVHYAN